MDPILYDRVFDEEGNLIFGEVPGEVYMWCYRIENRNRNLWVENSKTGEIEAVQDYLFKVE